MHYHMFDSRFNVLYGFLIKLDSIPDMDKEVEAEILHVLGKLASTFQVPKNGSLVQWLSDNVFFQNKNGGSKEQLKDKKKLDHLENILGGAKTKNDLLFKFEDKSVQVLEDAEMSSQNWRPGEVCNSL